MRDSFEKTQRGFAVYDKFVDRYNSEIVVQESSIAGEWCAWIFAYNDFDEKSIPHLTVDQAERLISALQKFIDHSKDPGDARNDPEYKKIWCDEE